MTRELSLCVAMAAVVAALTTTASAGEPAETWVQTTREDFAAGELDAAGQDLYVHAGGSVRTIQRFDLESDGFIDLIFNQTHDTVTDLPATLAAFRGRSLASVEQLAIGGSQRVVAADLNGDGALDLVFCPNRHGLQLPRQFVRVAWGGGPAGWSTSLTSAFPAQKPLDVAAADLDRDGWQDLCVLSYAEGWVGFDSDLPDTMVVRVFWGGPQGPAERNRVDLTVPLGTRLLAGDLDGVEGDDLLLLGRTGGAWLHTEAVARTGDGFAPSPIEAARGVRWRTAAIVPGETAILLAGDSESVLKLAAEDGQLSGSPLASVDPPVSFVTAGDLDGDGVNDIVALSLETARAMGGEQGAATGKGGVAIYWGGGNPGEGPPATRLDTDYPSAAAIGDIDGDGRPDLLVTRFQGEATFDAAPRIFWGIGDRRFRPEDIDVRLQGAADVQIVRVEAGTAHVVFCNSLGGTLDERVPVRVFSGGEDGFSAERFLDVPFKSGYESSAADLDADGRVDAVLLNSGHAAAEGDEWLGANIFWDAGGTAFGGKRSVLREPHLGSSGVADFDRDGYLDLALGAFEAEADNRLSIYFGTADGFSGDRRIHVPVAGGSTGLTIGDVDRDGWLDIAFGCFVTHRVYVLHNGPGGFDAGNLTELEVPAAIEVELADLNADGWLDMVASSYFDPLTGSFDTGVRLYWGGSDGYAATRSQWLPAMCSLGVTIADLDADGSLDLVLPQYHGNAGRQDVPSIIYWGDRGGYREDRRSTLVTDSASDALVADFDRDGRLDIAFACHSRDNTHVTDSLVYLNDGQRFAAPRIIRLPTRGAHWMQLQDMGHIADRRWRQVYTSAVRPLSRGLRRLTLRADFEVPAHGRARIEWRAAETPGRLLEAPWQAAQDETLPLPEHAGLFQYRAVFESDNGDAYPVLREVRASFFE